MGGFRIRGHRRIVEKLGNYSGPARQGNPNGYHLSCLCGWDGGHVARRTKAEEDFAAHLRTALRKCSVCDASFAQSQMSKSCPSRCKECVKNYHDEWVRKNPNPYERSKRRHHVMRKYGVTLEHVEQTIAQQGGVCGICRTEKIDVRGYRNHIDHCHESGEFRGVLCFSCNAGLGNFKDDIAKLKFAISYLEKFIENQRGIN